MWILIGILSGALITATFDNQEACQDLAASINQSQVAQVKCIEFTTSDIIWATPPTKE